MRQLFLILLLFSPLPFSPLQAQQRSAQEAEQAASDFLQGQRTKTFNTSRPRLAPVRGNLIEMELRLRGLQPPTSFANTAAQPFYVFNDEEAEGFVIVSGDKRMRTILGYAPTGAFPSANLPPALSELLSNFARQHHIVSHRPQLLTQHRAPRQWPEVPPFCTSTWGQWAPYNTLSPKVNNRLCPTGCLATSLAQVMYYYKYPNLARGTVSYTTATQKLQLSANLGKEPIHWDRMRDNYAGEQYTTTQANAVAQLMRNCGYALWMDYDTNTSVAFYLNLAYALVNHFKYNRNVTFCSRAYYTDEAWKQLIHRELEAQRPILYSGQDPDSPNEGHSFLVDGTDEDGYLHINWGWDGVCDGYFLFDELDFTDPYFNYNNYNYDQTIVVNISPEEVGRHEDTYNAYCFYTNETDVGWDDQVHFYVDSIYCYANVTRINDENATFKGEFALGIYDIHDNLLETAVRYQVENMATWGWHNWHYWIRPSAFAFEAGNCYFIRFVVINENGDVSPIHTLHGETDVIFVQADELGLHFSAEVPSAVADVKGRRAGSAQTFDLNGRPVRKPHSGQIHITNGRKHISL